LAYSNNYGEHLRYHHPIIYQKISQRVG
jgi:hypothetical protein